ncbi:MAG: hypothetical protein IJB88_05805 [Clostridia bacterium]|nr:hypothetical protein [Clostridia bacterium]MBQ3154729.1 hypothetical protein [Clostridia bacterium]
MKKHLALFFALLMLTLPVLAACGESNEVSEEVSKQVSETVSEDENVFPLEKKFFDTTVTILTRSGRFSQQFVPDEEYEGSAINAAVEARNQYIEENYGITIEIEKSTNPIVDIEASITTNTDNYDVVCDNVYSMIQRTTDNWFYTLNDILELDRPWWDQNANNMLTLSDKVFYVAGDAIFADDLFTAGVFYNKSVWTERYENQYGSLYDMVDNGTWTYDVMLELAKDFSQPDADGLWMTDGCYYGVVTDGYTGATMLTNGSGSVSAYKDEQNNIVLSGGSEASVKAFDKVYTMLNDTTVSLYAEQYSPTNWGAPGNYFNSGHALFQVGYISVLLGIMELESADKVNPGVLPIPKYDKEQEDYHCGINVYQSNVLALPVSNQKNLEATAYALELLGYYSTRESNFGKNCVTDAFYETSLKLQSVTDDNDSRMLDLITSSRIYDLGGAFNWGGLIGLYSSNLYRGSNTLVSTWEADFSKIEQAMLDTLDAYQNSVS